MNIAKSIVLVVAICAGLAAMYLASILVKAPQQQAVAPRAANTEVLVLLRNIQGGGVIQEADLRWVEWPEAGVTPGMITKTAEPTAIRNLVGKVMLQAAFPGEPVRRDKLLDTAGGGVLAAVIPPGKRAFAVTIDEKLTAGGFILPGDVVDILSLAGMTPQGPGTRIVIRGVKVLAIGHRIDPTGEKVALARFATVEVTPKQLELLASLELAGPLLLTPLNLLDGRNATAETSLFPPPVTQFGLVR
jgi:pilus assembly protein CpaB